MRTNKKLSTQCCGNWCDNIITHNRSKIESLLFFFFFFFFFIKRTFLLSCPDDKE
jgi:hypothetical protein